MIQHIFVLLLAALVALDVDSTKIKNITIKPLNIKPRALADEAETELDELRESVVGVIDAAQNNILTIGSDFMSLGIELIETGSVTLQQEYEDLLEKITALKGLAETAGVDPSSCTSNPEEVLSDSVTDYTDQIAQCIVPINMEAANILNDARYFVDVYINKVNQIEFELGLCAPDSIVCIAPIVTKIETGMVELPQQIQTEVTYVTQIFEDMRPSVQRCYDVQVSNYEFNGNALLATIEECVNQLLSSKL